MAKKKHNIKTIEDAVNCVTFKNISLFLNDFCECMVLAVALKEEYKKQHGKYPSEAVMKEFTWNDDGVPGLKKITIKK